MDSPKSDARIAVRIARSRKCQRSRFPRPPVTGSPGLHKEVWRFGRASNISLPPCSPSLPDACRCPPPAAGCAVAPSRPPPRSPPCEPLLHVLPNRRRTSFCSCCRTAPRKLYTSTPRSRRGVGAGGTSRALRSGSWRDRARGSLSRSTRQLPPRRTPPSERRPDVTRENEAGGASRRGCRPRPQKISTVVSR